MYISWILLVKVDQISSIPTEITKIGINHDYDVFVANNFRIRIHDG